MQGLQDQQELAGTTFPMGKHAYGGGLAPPWDTGGLQGFFSGLVAHVSVRTCPHLSSSGSWLTLGCHHGIGWANTFTENQTRARKEHPPYTLVSCAAHCSVHRPPTPPHPRSLPRLEQEEGQ